MNRILGIQEKVGKVLLQAVLTSANMKRLDA